MIFLVRGDYLERGKKDGMQTFKEKGNCGQLNSPFFIDHK